jgi:HEAT repeat protein
MLVPPLLALLGSPTAEIRRRALSVLNEMFGQMPAGFQAALPQYTEVGAVCRSVVREAELYVQRVVNDMFGQMPAGFQAALPQYTEVGAVCRSVVRMASCMCEAC